MIGINALIKLRHEMEGVADRIVEELRRNIPLDTIKEEDIEDDDGLTVGDTFPGERESKLIDLIGAYDAHKFEDLSVSEVYELVERLKEYAWFLGGDE